MKAISIVSAVVFLHVFVFITLVNGCRSTQDPSYKKLGEVQYEEPALGQEVVDVPLVEEPLQGQEAQTVPVAGTPEPKKPAVETSDAPKTYVVKPNESFWLIANRNKITVDQLLAANNLKRNTVLQAGKKLIIPAPQKQESTGTKNSDTASVDGDVYSVKKGDTLGGIAIKFKTSVAKIKEANNLKSDNIRIGQKLKIPAKNVAPATNEAEQVKSSGSVPAENSAVESDATSVPETTNDTAAEPVAGQPV